MLSTQTTGKVDRFGDGDGLGEDDGLGEGDGLGNGVKTHSDEHSDAQEWQHISQTASYSQKPSCIPL